MTGSTVAWHALAAGLDVVLSDSRGPEVLTGLVAELGEHARGAGPAEAAQAGQLVAVSVPLHADEQLSAASPVGKTVTDATQTSICYRPRQPVSRRPVESRQFGSWAFTQRARASGLLPWTGTIGDCVDNAMIWSPSGPGSRSNYSTADGGGPAWSCPPRSSSTWTSP